MKNQTENTNMVFMAIAKGVETKEFETKRYVGFAPVRVVAVNPNKKELESLYGREFEEPQYVSTVHNEKENKDVQSIRLSFIVQPDANRVSVDSLFNISMFLRKEYLFNSDKTKVKVIDKYGRTAWVTIEQAKNHEIPMYKNGPAKIDAGYRPMYRGEEELIDFIKCYLGIPNIDIYDNKTSTWMVNSNPSNCEVQFDSIDSFFSGNIKELKEAISYQPNNFIKVLFGVRENDGKTYQTFYTGKFAKNNAGTKIIEDTVKDTQANGGLSTSTFEFCDLKEYKPQATDFNKVESSTEMPFGNDGFPF
jgi:hypothetical protein